MKTIEELAKLLYSRPLVYGNEKELQDKIEELLKENGLRFTREGYLGKTDRPDFLIRIGNPPIPSEPFAAIEVKVKGSLNSHLRQLSRYAVYPAVSVVVLVCPKPWPMPETLAGKPCYCIHLYRSLI